MSEHIERVLRWEVAVDDLPHEIGGGDVLHVAQGRGGALNIVDVWTRERFDGPRLVKPKRRVQAYGTGQPIDWVAPHLGTAVAGPLVWHIFEVVPR